MSSSPAPTDLSLLVVGLGAAGASVAWRLAGGEVPFAVLQPPAGSAASVPERTWCTWGPRPPGPFGPLVARSWARVRVVAPDGEELDFDLGDWRYRMLHSVDVDRAVRERLAAAGVRVLEATAREMGAEGGRVRVTTEEGPLLADAVLDTSPAPLVGGRTLLRQHFLGRRVRSRRPVFDVATATLMDFRVPQPAGGVAFAYVLPTSSTEALVEYTEFSRDLLDDAGYAEKLGFCLELFGVADAEVLAEERGVIPMTDAHPVAHPVPGVVRMGQAGGAVRPSTGYAFSVLQRQADAVVANLRSGGRLDVPRPHRRRHLAMDSLVLQALVTGRVDGAEFFVNLFRRNPIRRTLSFLDGASTPWEDLQIMATAPRSAMMATIADRGADRLRGARPVPLRS
ncbi:lycopene cyclase family protein [Kineococcus gynurae]|uniref:Lycopene cyclase family protein n=1 Tax=Kineococcus gynurae TaxID=452979 RepID=A0ABV5LSW6_9ACTN